MSTAAEETPNVAVSPPNPVIETKSAIGLNSSPYGQLDPERPLAKFAAELPAILAAAEYDEMYGIQLKAGTDGSPTPHTTLLILQKFLRANANNLDGARTQLTEALEWRKVYQPRDLLEHVFPAAKFRGLGYVTRISGAKETKQSSDVVTFNVYGAAATKDPKIVFGDPDAFVRWRVALMELTLSHLHLDSATEIIPDYGKGPDPYLAVQVHDYQSVSFFRQPPEIKTASGKIIALFQKYYPETVSFKYFVNVPMIMSWMMALMKTLMSKDSVQKMTWMTSGAELSNYLGDEIPKEYGGKGRALTEVGQTVKYDDEEETKPTATATSTAQDPVVPPTSTTTAEKSVPAPAPVVPEQASVAPVTASEPAAPSVAEPVK